MQHGRAPAFAGARPWSKSVPPFDDRLPPEAEETEEDGEEAAQELDYGSQEDRLDEVAEDERHCGPDGSGSTVCSRGGTPPATAKFQGAAAVSVPAAPPSPATVISNSCGHSLPVTNSRPVASS